jgi:hypothetical protein
MYPLDKRAGQGSDDAYVQSNSLMKDPRQTGFFIYPFSRYSTYSDELS